MTNVITSPPVEQAPKQRQVPVSGNTKKEGVRSVWNGQRALGLRDEVSRSANSATIWTRSVRSFTSSIRPIRIVPGWQSDRERTRAPGFREPCACCRYRPLSRAVPGATILTAASGQCRQKRPRLRLFGEKAAAPGCGRGTRRLYSPREHAVAETGPDALGDRESVVVCHPADIVRGRLGVRT